MLSYLCCIGGSSMYDGLVTREDLYNSIKKEDLLTKEDVIEIIEEYMYRKEVEEDWQSPQELADTANVQPSYPVMEAWIVSISDDYKSAEISIPYHLGESAETLTAIVSAELMAWCMAWEKPAEYYSTIKESPFWGKLSVNGNDFQTTSPTIPLSTCVVAGAGVLVPPVAGCTVTGSATPTPPTTMVNPAVYKFTGNYDKMGSTIQTDKDKFLQQPIVSGLWPFNAIKQDWRKDEKFIKAGDRVAVIFLNGDATKPFITQIISFAD